jgi:aspartate kinase
MNHRVPVRVLSSFEGPVPSPNTGTLVCDEEQIVEKQVVSGVAYSRDEAKFTLIGVEDHPGVAAIIFGELADAGVNVDMIVQASAKTDGRQNIVFTAPDRDASHAQAVLEKARPKIGYQQLTVGRDVAKVSVIGVGMRSHAGVAKTMFQALSAKGINIQVISTSEIKISVLIDANYTELAVRTLHTA